MNKKSVIIIGLLCCAATPALAQAQSQPSAPSQDGSSAPETAIPEIVVTAQRREQRLQDVPVALSAIDEKALDALNATDITSLTSATPGISGVQQGVLQPVIAIRGISSNSFGIGGEASVGVFIDDAYLGRLSGSSVPFLDIERVEILRGPQGSLYGRNATAGAISIITNRPSLDRVSGELSGSYGRFNAYEAQAIGNLPISDKAAVRLALLARGGDGFDRNIITGTRAQGVQTFGGRLSLLLEPSDAVTIDASLAYSNEAATAYPFKTTDPALAAAGGVDANPFSGRFAHEVDGDENRETLGGNITIEWSASDAFSVKSVTSFNRSEVDSIYDIDGSALALLRADFSDGVSNTFGQEFRGTYRSGGITLQFGVNAFFERIRDQRALVFDDSLLLPDIGTAVFGTADGSVPADALFAGSPAFAFCDPTSIVVLGVACSPQLTETIRQRGRYASYAGFVDAEFELSPTVFATVSGRYSIDRKRFFFSNPLVASQGSAILGTNVIATAVTDGLALRQTWRDFQPRAVLRWTPIRDLTFYGSITRGFKSGGFDPAGANGVASAALTQFDAERVWSFEVGAKVALMDRRVQLNLAAYRSNYKGFQVQLFQNGITSTLNVPKFNGYGFEGDVTFRPTNAVTLTAGVSWNGSQYGNFIVDDPINPGGTINLSGNRSIVSPEWSGFLRGDVVAPLSRNLQLRFNADASFRGRQFFTIYNDPAESTDGYTLVNGSIGIEHPDGGWSLSLVGQNLFNKNYLLNGIDQGFGVVTARGRPRSVSVEARFRF